MKITATPRFFFPLTKKVDIEQYRGQPSRRGSGHVEVGLSLKDRLNSLLTVDSNLFHGGENPFHNSLITGIIIEAHECFIEYGKSPVFACFIQYTQISINVTEIFPSPGDVRRTGRALDMGYAFVNNIPKSFAIENELAKKVVETSQTIHKKNGKESLGVPILDPDNDRLKGLIIWEDQGGAGFTGDDIQVARSFCDVVAVPLKKWGRPDYESPPPALQS